MIGAIDTQVRSGELGSKEEAATRNILRRWLVVRTTQTAAVDADDAGELHAADLVEDDLERGCLVLVTVDSVIVKFRRECGAGSSGELAAGDGECRLGGATIIGVGAAIDDSFVVQDRDGVADGWLGDVELSGEESQSARAQGVEVLDNLEL